MLFVPELDGRTVSRLGNTLTIWMPQDAYYTPATFATRVGADQVELQPRRHIEAGALLIFGLAHIHPPQLYLQTKFATFSRASSLDLHHLHPSTSLDHPRPDASASPRVGQLASAGAPTGTFTLGIAFPVLFFL